jgi:peptide/nickel transport system substrate-binding protein
MLLVATLVGCGVLGGGDAGEVDKAETREALPIPPSAITMQGQPGTFGGTLRVALPEDLTTFNPYALAPASTTEVLHLLYAPLVGFNPVTGKILPQDGLAQSFEANGRKVTIHMRQGLSFSDGTPIRADDVVFSLKVATDKDLHAPIADMLTTSGRLPEITKVDSDTVELLFTEPYPAIGYVLSQLPIISAGPDPDAAIEKGRYEEILTLDTRTVAASGPFKVGSHEKGKSITLDYNPHYWKVDSQSKRLPYLDHVVFRFGVANDEVAKGLESGAISLAVDVAPKAFAELGEGKGQCAVKDLGVGYGTWQLFGNINIATAADKVKVSWLINQKFREFMSRVVDRDAIVKEVFAGKAQPAYGPVTSANQVWHNASAKKIPFDPANALSALGSEFKVVERAGKPQLVDVVDRTVKFNMYFPKTPEGEAISQIIVDRFAKVGVPIAAQGVKPDRLLAQYLTPRNFELALFPVDGFGPDPISYMPAMMMNGSKHWFAFTESGGRPLSGLDFELDIGRLMRSQQDKTLDADRQREFAEVQKIWAEQAPVTYVVAPNVLVAYDKRLGNFQPVAFRPYATWNAEQLFYKR